MPAAIGLFALAPAAGAEEELVTDRPDQTESPVTVPPDRVQIEAGWEGERSDSTDGSTLIRVGLDPRLEMRFGWGGFVHTDEEPGEPEAEGSADTELGAKVGIVGERGRRPETALIFGVTLPTGKDGVGSERVDPRFRFACAHTLSDRIGLGYNLGAAWESSPDAEGDLHRLSRVEYTASAAFGVSPRAGLFVEVFGDALGSAGGAPAHSLDGGVTWLAADRVQFDLAGGFALTSAADDWFVGLGISARLPR